jgi:RNA polymerase sigma-B factor
VSADPPDAPIQLAGRRRLEVDRELFARLAQTGSAADRDALIERFLPLARSLASRFNARGDAFDDVFQVACVGLVKAIDRYDADRGGAFSSFAVPTIAGEIKRHFRDRTWTLHVPRDLKERTLKVGGAIETLESELGRKPTVAELAARLQAGVEEVLDALQATHAKRARSLDAPALGGSAEDEGLALGATLGVEEAGFAHVERSETLRRLMVALTDRERAVVWLRFEEDLTQQEIGDRIGVSQMQVSRILREATDKLRVLARHQGLTACEGDLALTA